MDKLRFGIIGAGRIAGRWMTDARLLSEVQVTCVAARDLDKVRKFAREWEIPNALDSYDALLRHPEVDAVYIATPHPQHHAQAIAAMRAGKHVLCEKPVAINAAQLREMQACARENGVFFMEAMWTRCFPSTLRAKELVERGAIGELRAVHAQFSFRREINPDARLFDLKKGGGALLDVGCYPLGFALDMFGCAPEQVCGVATIGETGVDEQNALSLRFPGGGIAMLMSGIRTDAPVVATLYGTEGKMELPDFYHPMRILLTKPEGTMTLEDPYEQEGFRFEILHFAECVRAGLKESPRMSFAHSMELMVAMDTLRAQWGLRYPME